MHPNDMKLLITESEQRITDMERMLGLAVIGGNESFRTTLEYLIDVEEDWLAGLEQQQDESDEPPEDDSDAEEVREDRW